MPSDYADYQTVMRVLTNAPDARKAFLRLVSGTQHTWCIYAAGQSDVEEAKQALDEAGDERTRLNRRVQ